MDLFAKRDTLRLAKREAVGMEELVEAYIKDMKLSFGLGRQRVFAAWDEASGAGAYTISKYMKGQVLYCKISSSVLRQQLYFRKRQILEKMNEILVNDPLFIEDKSGNYLKNIILQ